jgi:hypothetical protein
MRNHVHDLLDVAGVLQPDLHMLNKLNNTQIDKVQILSFVACNNIPNLSFVPDS